MALDTFIGVYDFAYCPYALGDSLTWQAQVAVAARAARRPRVEHVLVAEPSAPACWMQPHVDGANYAATLAGVLPAFLCGPDQVALRVFRDRDALNLFLAARAAGGARFHPPLRLHLDSRMHPKNPVHNGFPLEHAAINRFHARHGSIPRLRAPLGYRAFAARYRATRLRGRTAVAIHIRQSARTAAPSALHRDSPAAEWRAFLARAHERHPGVAFVLLGAAREWPRRFLRLPNVVIPRTEGLNLAHELALLASADLFMGSSSGFSAMASFSDVPYLITNVEHDFAQYADLPVGAPRFPFGGEHQRLLWKPETAAELADFLEAFLERRPG